MELDKLEIAWAAGLFEGEGSFYNGGDHCGVRSFNTGIGSFTDLDVLQRFHKAIGGLGKIYGPYHPKTSDGRDKKTTWTWRALNFEDSQAVMALIWPWLGVRRRSRAKECLIAFLNKPKAAKYSRKAQSAKRPEILKLKAAGMKNSEIAAMLDVSRAFVTIVK